MKIKLKNILALDHLQFVELKIQKNYNCNAKIKPRINGKLLFIEKDASTCC